MCSKLYFCDCIIADTLQYNWWKERGMVKFEQKFDTISDSVATKIKNKIKKLENDYKIAYEGSIPRVSDGTYHMKNINATDEARLLLLSSGNNSLAEAIKEHLRIRYDCRFS